MINTKIGDKIRYAGRLWQAIGIGKCNAHYNCNLASFKCKDIVKPILFCDTEIDYRKKMYYDFKVERIRNTIKLR